MHELILLFLAALREKENRSAVLLLKLEAQFGADPLLRSVYALPSHALSGISSITVMSLKPLSSNRNWIDRATQEAL